jgi:hypothetical protein
LTIKKIYRGVKHDGKRKAISNDKRGKRETGTGT